MSKPIVKIVCSILVLLVTILAVSACAQKPEPEYAGQIAENILVAMNEGDYAKYSENFNEDMKTALPESAFTQANTQIKAKIGDYVSKTFWKAGTESGYTVVHYKAKFTQEPESVIVKVIFQETEGKIYVAGLWFDSPELRQN